MNCAIQDWIQVFNAMLTPIIAILAVMIGFFQWRTAQTKVVIDLFDRRMKTYTELREIVRKVRAAGRATNQDGFDFRDAVNDAEFLFGKEIVQELIKIREAIWNLQCLGDERRGLPSSQEHKIEDAEKVARDTIDGSYEKFPVLFTHYMRMHQKMPWSCRTSPIA